MKYKFQLPANFNVYQYYKNCFGIVSPNSDNPTEVILSLDPLQGKYVKTLPLHQSQEILIDNKEELRVKLIIFITHDFFMELLSYGDNLRVVKPESLINDLKSTFKNTLKLYN